MSQIAVTTSSARFEAKACDKLSDGLKHRWGYRYPGAAQRYAEALDLHILPHLGSLYFDVFGPPTCRTGSTASSRRRYPSG